MDCPNKTEILDSSTLNPLEESDDLSETCNNVMWTPSTKGLEENQSIIFDLKCQTRLESFSIMNGFGDFGIQDYSLQGARNLEGPWTKLYGGELSLGQEMTDEVRSS